MLGQWAGSWPCLMCVDRQIPFRDSPAGAAQSSYLRVFSILDHCETCDIKLPA